MDQGKFTNQYALADQLGWQRSKVSTTGRQNWSEDDKQAAKLTCTSSYTKSHFARQGHYRRSVPVQLCAVLGSDTTIVAPTCGSKSRVALPLLHGRPWVHRGYERKRLQGLCVRGKANSPRYCEGDFLIVNTALDSLQGSGDYLVDMGGFADSRGIEQYRDEDDIERWHLTCHNPEYSDRIVKPRSYRILGGIVGQMRSV